MSYRDVLSEVLGEPRRGAEIGLYAGTTTGFLLGRFRALHLYGVDMWRVRERLPREGFQTYHGHDFLGVRRRFDDSVFPYADRVTVLELDSVDAARKVENGSLDFVFIDAEHTYEAVLADIEAWRPKVRPGGILSGPDYGHPRFPGVKRAVDICCAPQVRETVWWTRLE